ncbi:MAG: MGMT family protein [Alistipes sp.]|nr:MGMT family protein [Alistipes sp.]
MRPAADFAAEVCAVVRQIPPGRVATYGLVARLVGMPAHARRVGRALRDADAGVPCHRVVNAAGRCVPGWAGQRALLEAEGVPFRANGRVDLERALWPLLDSDAAGDE